MLQYNKIRSSGPAKKTSTGGRFRDEHTPSQKYTHNLSTGMVGPEKLWRTRLINGLKRDNTLILKEYIFQHFLPQGVDNCRVPEYDAISGLAKTPARLEHEIITY
jgi:hypothetical protein